MLWAYDHNTFVDPFRKKVYFEVCFGLVMLSEVIFQNQICH